MNNICWDIIDLVLKYITTNSTSITDKSYTNMKLWEIIKDPNTEWKDIRLKIDDSVDTVLRYPLVRYYDERESYDLYEMYCVYSYEDARVKEEFFQYLDSVCTANASASHHITSKRLRMLLKRDVHHRHITPVNESTSSLYNKLTCEYTISRYRSGRLTLESLELMIVEKVECVGLVLMILMEDTLKNNGDISDIIDIIGEHRPLYLNPMRLFSRYGREEDFKNNTLGFVTDAGWSVGVFIRMCYEVSRERLVEAIGYLMSTGANNDEHSKLCHMIRSYTSQNSKIDDDIMGALLELLGDRELIYDSLYSTHLHSWIERMKDNQV